MPRVTRSNLVVIFRPDAPFLRSEKITSRKVELCLTLLVVSNWAHRPTGHLASATKRDGAHGVLNVTRGHFKNLTAPASNRTVILRQAYVLGESSEIGGLAGFGVFQTCSGSVSDFFSLVELANWHQLAPSGTCYHSTFDVSFVFDDETSGAYFAKIFSRRAAFVVRAVPSSPEAPQSPSCARSTKPGALGRLDSLEEGQRNERRQRDD